MAKAKRKEPIGEAPCPFKGCGCTMKVFRFEPESDRPSMFKGRMYGVCETFGRYGADGKPASQEYLLTEANIWGAKKPAGDGSEKPEKPQEKPAPQPAQSSAKPTPKEPAKPAPKPAVKPAQDPAPKPDQQPSKPEKTGWGFF